MLRFFNRKSGKQRAEVEILTLRGLGCKQHDATEETKAHPIEKQIEEQFSDYYG